MGGNVTGKWLFTITVVVLTIVWWCGSLGQGTVVVVDAPFPGDASWAKLGGEVEEEELVDSDEEEAVEGDEATKVLDTEGCWWCESYLGKA